LDLFSNRMQGHCGRRAWLRAVCLCCVATSLLAVRNYAQPPSMTADAKPGVEVATIKPSRPDEQQSVVVNGTRLATSDTSLVDLMMFAYGIHPAQIANGPAWISTEKFDTVVQPDLPGRPSTPQMHLIIQQLLTDRFGLAFHYERRPLPVYRIVVAKGGPHLTPAAKQSIAGNTAAIGFSCGAMTVINASVGDLASLMQRYVALDRPIVDDTGIRGRYDLKLSWTPDFSQCHGQLPGPARSSDDAPPSLYTAFEEQLGLRLEAAREPTQVMEIDHVDRPSEN
jgi:uncharacterized protein (TIGR03435 family)